MNTRLISEYNEKAARIKRQLGRLETLTKRYFHAAGDQDTKAAIEDEHEKHYRRIITYVHTVPRRRAR